MPCKQDCQVIISNTRNKIHYVSEWDPRQPAHTKGGYLEGKIILPSHVRPMIMNIETYPAQGIGNEEALRYEVHPSIIHNVRMGRGKREQEKEPVPSDCHWRQRYLIEDGSVIILNQTSHFDKGRNVPQQDKVTRVLDNTITLGRKNQELNLIIVQPKQRSRADAEEATLTKVIDSRLASRGICSSDITNRLVKCFKGAQFGKNMKQVRLKVDFTDYETNQPIASTISEDTISDYTNKHIGPLELATATPLKSCMEGGRKVIIVSEQNLPKNVEPIFQIWSGDIERRDLQRYITQPSDVQVRADSIIFLTPPQDLLSGLDLKNLTLTLAVKRTEDGHISNKKFVFHYENHEVENCLYCHQNLDTDEEVNLNQTKTGKKSRAFPTSPKNTSQVSVSISNTNSTIGNDPYSKMDELSVGSYSPSSGYISSPEYVPFEPPYKRPRQSTPEREITLDDQIPTTVSEISDSITRFPTNYGLESYLYDIKSEDVREFDRDTDGLILRDGARVSVSPREPKARAQLEVISHELQTKENIPETQKDYLNCFSHLVFLFFIFLFLQVFGFMFLFHEEEEIPLFEFSSSSIVFSMTSLLM